MNRNIIRRSPLSRIFTSRRLLSTHPAGNVTVGIRREDPTRIWERRCPITPEAVEHLVQKEGVNVLVQDCDRRIFPIADFVKVCGQFRCWQSVLPVSTFSHLLIAIRHAPIRSSTAVLYTDRLRFRLARKCTRPWNQRT